MVIDPTFDRIPSEKIMEKTCFLFSGNVENFCAWNVGIYTPQNTGFSGPVATNCKMCVICHYTYKHLFV